MRAELKNVRRKTRRKLSTRNGIRRNSDRVRLQVHRSSKHIYAQLIDDEAGRTVAAFGSSAKTFVTGNQGMTKTDQAKAVGEEIAKRAIAAGVDTVVFDRGSSRYHGRVKALADSAREAGLKF